MPSGLGAEDGEDLAKAWAISSFESGVVEGSFGGKKWSFVDGYLVRDLNPKPFFSFSFFFYHVFIVSRYKKLCAVLAMERPKPINQNIKYKKLSSMFSTI